MAVSGVSSSTSTGYSETQPAPVQGGGIMPDTSSKSDTTGNYWSISRLRRAYSDYLDSKSLEIQEQQQSRRYRHGVQWTAEQVKVFNDRRQPVVTFNRIGPKINSIVSNAENLKADPKAYATQPRHQQGADLATAALRSAMETNKWDRLVSRCAGNGAVDGIGGVQILLKQSPRGLDIKLEVVDNEGFFYDPRSKLPDFEDATYLGIGKWIDGDVAKDLMPDKASEIDAAIGAMELTHNSDQDDKWFMQSGEFKNVRLVYICYRHRGGWCWALFTGYSILMEGKSYFVDRDGKPICSLIMFSAEVDQDGDRYGFVRNLKSVQDEINQRRSKALHELNTRRIVAEKGAFDDIEKARREAVRPDGVIERNKGYEAEFDDAKKAQDITGQLRFLEDAKIEIDKFGPDRTAIAGADAVNNRSGRAISLLQQMGIAELGPFIMSFKDWRQRVYETVYHGLRKYWTNERWIKLTDEMGQQQFVQLNAMQLNGAGMPIIVNSIGELDVDIVLDEGPDVVTLMQDYFDTLAAIIPAVAPMLAPPQVQALISELMEYSPSPAKAKQRFQQASLAAQQPNPLQVAAQQLQLSGAQAEVDETKSKTMLNLAKAQAEGMPDTGGIKPTEFQLPPIVQVESALADIEKKRSDAAHKRSLAGTEEAFRRLAPFDLAQKAFDAAADRQSKAFTAAADRQVQREEIAAYRQKPGA
jgi:hypothetical protein